MTNNLNQHLEYFPYGETWVHNKATSGQVSTPYKFTSKELDEETGLYYFGARYYDARLSRWVSADPAMSTGEYFPTGNKKRNANLPGMGGVFNPANLDAYQYAHNNPARYTDPDGRVTFDQKTKKLVAEPGGSVPVNNRETRVKQKDKGMNPDGSDSACRYRAIQASAEEYVKKNLTVTEINSLTKNHYSGKKAGLDSGTYSVNNPGKIVESALKELGVDTSKYDIYIVKPGQEGYNEAAGNATYSLRGMESRKHPGEVGHWQLCDSNGNFLWDPSNGPSYDTTRKQLTTEYIFIRPKEEE